MIKVRNFTLVLFALLAIAATSTTALVTLTSHDTSTTIQVAEGGRVNGG